jgi:alpha-beta hydrolase superfamily lysophospholipase
MKPFFFGDSARPLFGLHHPPSGGTPRRWGVVICNPFGQEYLRAHRSLRELANRLAAEGFHVLRFDYYASGDSSGDSDEATLDQWLLDISAAIAEVKEASASPRFALVGLRLGATLSAQLAAQRRDVERLVLWDPILDGSAYLGELRAAHAAWLREHAQHRNGPGEEDPLREALGFPVPPGLAASLERLRLTGADGPSANVLVIDHRSFPGAQVWLHQDGLNRTLVPQAVVESITSWLASTCQ